MQQRISHKKSRAGCTSCKKKHVKCDESGPPCANCSIRGLECIYPPPAPSKKALARAARAARDSSDGSSGSSGLQTPPEENARALAQRRGVPTIAAPTTSLAAFSATVEIDRVLELELMHRWSTKTWEGFYAVPECKEANQVQVPAAAFGSPYLMYGIFATAALDTALTCSPQDKPKYLRAALEYGQRSSEETRRELEKPLTPDSLWQLVHSGSLASVRHLAHPAEDYSALERFVDFFEVSLASFKICISNVDWYFQKYAPAGAMVKAYPQDLELMKQIDHNTKMAIDRMNKVARVVRLTPTGDPSIDAGPGQGPYAEKHPAYQLAIGQTKYAYAERRIKCYFQSVITVAGPMFAAALRKREPVSLFICMYIGVLMQWSSYDAYCWWARDYGREIVDEISHILLHGPLSVLDDMREGLGWCRHQVGLKQIQGYEAVSLSGILELSDGVAGSSLEVSVECSSQFGTMGLNTVVPPPTEDPSWVPKHKGDEEWTVEEEARIRTKAAMSKTYNTEIPTFHKMELDIYGPRRKAQLRQNAG